ncbi:MAG: TerB family tellurite resistance protein [Gammaproteobacteria bacterium]|nr:TerB family tellurite resistance protein [Gammaproteobacteria bacterium]
MIKRLYKIISQREQAENTVDDARALQLATAALLMEVASADFEISESERETVRRLVEENYGVTANEAAEIAARAEKDSRHVTSLYPFTQMIKDGCSMEDRIEIVNMLWQVTAADGAIDAHETHLVRKIADLLYVPHSEFIRTRLQHDDR